MEDIEKNYFYSENVANKTSPWPNIDMAEKLLSGYKNEIESLTLYPSSGGVFEVKLNDILIYSKKETGVFPEFTDITKAIAKK